MAGSSNGGGDFGAMAQINVTPLVDVMLVLLVIFMVTAPMMQQGVDVDLPKATNGPIKGNAEQVVVSIDKNEKIYLGAGNEISLQELSVKAKAVMQQRAEADRKIYIKADSGIRYGAIMEVMGKLHEGGIDQIGLISAPVEPGSK